MPHQLNAELESWSGSGVFHPITSQYRRKPVDQFADKPARLTPRQAIFYRNLIRIAEETKSRDLPLEYVLPGGTHVHLDYGCIKIAVLAGFLEPLVNGPSGLVENITLSWLVEPTTTA
ncbi:MAG TPA: hypothetical protein VGZ49_08725 [Xanthobacteraceae bacterium]|jgi:hypothetical protein|nr:hypothetical protein [Xanthobacteraceae bacterium]